MVKFITVGQSLLVAAILASGIACTLSAVAADGGYEGLMAPATDDAPAKAPAGAVDEQQAPGYSGLVASPSAADKEDQTEQTEQFTPTPNSAPSHDLGVMSMVHGMAQNNHGIKKPKVDFSAASHSVIKNKPAEEYVIGKNIEHAMASVNDQSLSGNERAKAAQKAYKSLSALADGLRYQQTIPDNVYKQMKLSDAYINDERTSNNAALTQLDAALATLKTYQ